MHDELYIKMVLVNNYISDSEMERYFELFKDDHLRFFERCHDLQDFRIVNKF